MRRGARIGAATQPVQLCSRPGQALRPACAAPGIPSQALAQLLPLLRRNAAEVGNCHRAGAHVHLSLLSVSSTVLLDLTLRPQKWDSLSQALEQLGVYTTRASHGRTLASLSDPYT
ncbi:hypothetical protein H920_12755 [Fukomys damarensis]|uniref:Uncharacterized protein n=1 Tax=Fukomys damarensis TaxID=885580 RepID=A0A091D482_FUKDA|nr:hypothetical protein H920_12755 [Fukomys damarensis]